MCGRFNVIDDPMMHALLDGLGIDLGKHSLRGSQDVAPTDQTNIVRMERDSPVVAPAVWWLLLEQTSAGLKPNRNYATFNTRSDKLNKPGSVGFDPFRASRVIIPVSGFIETEKGQAYSIRATSNAMALGGISRCWIDRVSGETVYSCSIITLPPHPKLMPFHAKSMPLIMPLNDEACRAWLSTAPLSEQQTGQFLQPAIPFPLSITPIEKTSSPVPVGDRIHVKAD